MNLDGGYYNLHQNISRLDWPISIFFLTAAFGRCLQGGVRCGTGVRAPAGWLPPEHLNHCAPSIVKSTENRFQETHLTKIISAGYRFSFPTHSSIIQNRFD
jgi:hypothetical protein